MFEYVKPAEVKIIKVRAIDIDEVYSNSEWASIEYNAEAVTENLKYTPVTTTEMVTKGYNVYCPLSAVPDSGEVVLPDTYNGLPVINFLTT